MPNSCTEELNFFKYSNLHYLAKSLGLQANLRANKWLKTLKVHPKYQARKENKNQNENQTSTSSFDKIEILINR
uniref:Uncharacterized protein n=1 Tax=Sciurus vulgaris TaxID=55149 RepID=A0A8D2DIU6_SCIVU